MNMLKEIDTKRLFVFLILGMFLLSFSMSFVSGQDATRSVDRIITDEDTGEKLILYNDGTTEPYSDASEDVREGIQSAGDSFKNFFTDWQSQEAGANTAKIIFAIIIAIGLFLLITSVDKPTNDNKGRTYLWLLLSGLISFLITMYIAPAEIYSLLNSYTALGLTLITLIPLGVLGLLTYRAATSQNVGLQMLQWFAWVVYAIFLAYRLILDAWILKEGFWATNVTLVIVLGIAAFVAVKNKWISKIITKRYLNDIRDNSESNIKGAATTILNLNEFNKKTGGG